MENIDLTIHKDIFLKYQPEAEKEAEDNDYEKNSLVFNKLKLDVDDVELGQDGELTVWGDLENKGDNFGWLQVSFVVNTDLAIKIIEMYMKKLGKLKTILEAAK